MIKRRLSKLEGSATTNIDQHGGHLVKLLAMIDAAFWPERQAENAMQKLIVRRRYHEGGLEWSGTSGGGSGRAWKSDQRLRDQLQAAGLITLKKTKANLPLVRLTPQSEQMARCLVGIPDMFFAPGIVKAIQVNEDRQGGWCCETSVFGTDYAARPQSSDWDHATLLVLPLLVSGCVESRCSTNNSIFYRVTDRKLPEYVQCDQSKDYDLARLYIDEFFDNLKRFESLNEPTNEICIPLSATR